MKKIAQKLSKLIDFLIRVLLKVVKTGTKVLQEIDRAKIKSDKLAPILLEIIAVIQTLQAKKEEIEKVAEEE